MRPVMCNMRKMFFQMFKIELLSERCPINKLYDVRYTVLIFLLSTMMSFPDEVSGEFAKGRYKCWTST